MQLCVNGVCVYKEKMSRVIATGLTKTSRRVSLTDVKPRNVVKGKPIMRPGCTKGLGQSCFNEIPLAGM